ncbi:uncharacterized protein LOC141901685 [Tubulanus polymorphus]|uniref:uncharacterized protein LOC141901685 n=1 Tax=Tubulanus polymorphus TaxID=672921 RepID=UPI003DA42533
MAVKISGQIKFAGGEPESFPSGSFMTVKCEDTSLMDVAAVLLKHCTIDVSDYKKGKPLTYEMQVDPPADPRPEITMSCVINVGWKAQGHEWIRRGDYLNDTSHPIQFHATDPVIRHIEVIHYK